MHVSLGVGYAEHSLSSSNEVVFEASEQMALLHPDPVHIQFLLADVILQFSGEV